MLWLHLTPFDQGGLRGFGGEVAKGSDYNCAAMLQWSKVLGALRAVTSAGWMDGAGMMKGAAFTARNCLSFVGLSEGWMGSVWTVSPCS